MENNGKGIFYGVIGVATLIVAIIGATFAFFSASADAEDDNFTGQTLDLGGSVLSVEVDRVTLTTTPASGDNLVPADFGAESPSAVDLADVQAALAQDCVDKGYTGCHVWKVTATTTQAVDSASVLLDLEVTANDTSQWGYAVYTDDGDGSAADALAIVPDGQSAIGALSSKLNKLDMHNAEELAAGSVTYYVMVFLNNVNSSQNTTGEGAVDATGSYQGAVRFQAGSGQVSASFTAS